jgi:hydrogenase large subunit
MATRITKTIDPLTRIEGHLKVKIDVQDAKVADAWASGLLFRGFETILVGRDPQDAPTIVQRVCGVCHAVHRLTSIQALENAAGVVPPPDAVRIRNIEQAVTFLYSHAAHVFMLAGPDFDLYGLVPGLSRGENQALHHSVLKTAVLPAQRLCHEIGAVFGGKTPHHMTTLPGGVTCPPTQGAKDAALNKLAQVKSLLGTYLPKVGAYLETNRAAMESIGVGSGNMLAFGVFSDPNDPLNPSKLALKRGVLINGALQAVDTARITEAVTHSWYTEASGGAPSSERAPEPSYGKTGAYSWVKAPRYGGAVCEVGPLARMAVSGLYRRRTSLYDRLKARVAETEFLLQKVEQWIRDLTPGSNVYTPFLTPLTASGSALWEAPRGANGHWLRIEGGKIARYQIVPPTNWNASPRDAKDVRGPIEQALIGAPVADPGSATNALKIVRSFDPCIACSVH